ncbi:unnamed protein product, partial [Effrenium voratum]
SARLCEALRTRGPRGVQEHQPGGEALSGRQCGPPGPQRHERAQRASTGHRQDRAEPLADCHGPEFPGR